MEHIRIAPDKDSDPDIEAAGWCAARVHELLLMVSGLKDLRGSIPPQFQSPSWLAKRWNLTPADLPGVAPEDFIANGVQRLIRVGLLSVDGNCWVIRNWEKFYKSAKTGAQRQAEYEERERQKRQGLTKTDETDETDATPHHSTTHTPQQPSVGEPTDCAGPSDEDVARLKDEWNALTSPPIPRWEKTPKLRRRLALNALKRRPLSEWREVFRLANDSPYCRGENDSGWLADPDYVLRPEGKKPEPAAQALERAGAFRLPRKDLFVSGRKPEAVAQPLKHLG